MKYAYIKDYCGQCCTRIKGYNKMGVLHFPVPWKVMVCKKMKILQFPLSLKFWFAK